MILGTNNNSGVHVDTDVLIVGAGPIGLILACGLAYHKINFRIIEKYAGASNDSKAHNLIARSQELLQSIGILGPIFDKSYPTTEMDILLNKNFLASYDSRTDESRFDKWLFSSQSVFEECFRSALSKQGFQIEQNKCFVGLTQFEDHVVAQVSDSVNSESVKTITCRYLVGADGANGVVRNHVGLDFELEEMKGKATRQIDAKLAWRRPIDFKKGWFFLFDGGFGGILPVWEENYRLFLVEDEETIPKRKPTMEEMQSRAREITGDRTLTFSNLKWSSYGKFKCGVAPAYLKDRVFLAGDAGHGALPIGGQGMNSGIHDAIGLSWRLAMHLKLGGCAKILESYSAERHRAHAELNAQQVEGFNRIMHRSKIGDTAITTLSDLIPNFASKMFGANDLQQLKVSYPNSPISEDNLKQSLWKNSVSAGDRIPDAIIISSNSQKIYLHDLINQREKISFEWTLIIFDGTDFSSEAIKKFKSIVGLSTWIKLVVIISDPQRDLDNLQTINTFDFDSEVRRKFGLIDRSCVMLIRPDCHAAFTCNIDEYDLFENYVRRVTL